MTKLEEILAEYEDFELAFLFKYKYDTYLDYSKKAILAELAKRNLTIEKIELFIEKYENQTINDGILRCPRCLSAKIAKDSVEFWNTYGRSGLADDIAALDGLSGKQTYKDKLTCIVCDYVVHDPNAGGIIDLPETLSRFFKSIFKKKSKS